MPMVAIRGAITVSENTKEAILDGSKELIQAVLEANAIQEDEIIEILFTATSDLTAVYPAVGARALGITRAALMCMQEMHVEGSLRMCIRLAMHLETSRLTQQTVRHQYLREATKLRPDLKEKREEA